MLSFLERINCVYKGKTRALGGSLTKILLIKELIMLEYVWYAIIIVAIAIALEIAIRKLANIGMFWVRIPEMTGLAITRDRVYDKVYVACSTEVWDEIVMCCNPDDVGKNIIRVKKGLKYIGRPWVYGVYEWHMTKTDQENARVKPLHSLPLSILTIEYDPENIDSLNGTPNLKTADGVDVRAKLIAYVVIRNPWKALFNVEHIKTFLRGQIMAQWRETLSGFQFFQYITKETAKEEIYLRAQMKKLNDDLRKKIGVIREEEKRCFFQNPKKLEGIQKFIFDEGGMIITDITLDEFEAADPAVETALEQLLIGKAEAQKVIQNATGTREALKLEGEGKKAYIELVAGAIDAKGDTGRFLQALNTIETATANLSKAQNLTVFGLNEILGPLGQALRDGVSKISPGG